jgi:RNA-directed DNA polymerase
MHQDLRAIQEAKQIAEAWLAQMGLKLKEAKTRIAHTLTQELGTPGFDFLGFNIRQHEQGKTRYRVGPHGIKHFRTIIVPSKATKQTHRKALSQVIRSMRTSPQVDLIRRLNPIITGWANYQAIGTAKGLHKMDNVLYQQLKRWARRRHPKKHWKWVAQKYWHTMGKSRWVFSTSQENGLAHHARRVIRQKPVRNGSPFDGDWRYWSSRLGRHPGIPPTTAYLLRKQKGQCPHCGLYFTTEALLERDHIIPVAHGGSRHRDNTQILHAHCHDVKTANDRAGCIQ